MRIQNELDDDMRLQVVRTLKTKLEQKIKLG
jgi:hypothetical protein